jgi:hypothetical protein
MFRSLPKRAVLSWLLHRLGPPPPPPRRHFSKSLEYDAKRPAIAGRGRGHRGPGYARHPDGQRKAS